MPDGKRCPRCKETKSLGLFYRDSTKPSGLSSHCKVCSGNARRPDYREQERSCETIEERYALFLRRALKDIRKKSRQRGWDVDAIPEREFFLGLLEDRCWVCGELYTFVDHDGLRRPSIDRRDPTKGYETGNIDLMCHRCNVTKASCTPIFMARYLLGLLIKIFEDATLHGRGGAHVREMETSK